VFSIRDNGIGIKEADRLKIFDVFTRLHTRTEFAGTGIGLAICKKIVDVYQGRIWTEPSEGEGSTFKFTIPDQAGTMNSQVAEAQAM
jgi:chemotaxis family two-component system sensor kinase Cph1